MKKIAIIPARGGSKRIPKKNIKFFYGKPIISYSIEVAKKSNLFDEIMVSTDCEEIAKIAISFGAKVPFYRTKKYLTKFPLFFPIRDILERKEVSHVNKQSMTFGCYTEALFYPLKA